MSKRVQQREQTRARIVEAAVEAFAERGFHGASTRQIAARAGVNQGLISYHFGSKETLWRHAMNQTFEALDATMQERLNQLPDADPRAQARELIRVYVRFAAARPALFRLMVQQGKVADERLAWLIETHLRGVYERFQGLADAMGLGDDAALKAHGYYMLVGAGALLFVVAPECAQLTGVDPRHPDAVERHAELVARMLVP